MRFREHRGTLADSMATAVDFATRVDLMAHLRTVVPRLAGFPVTVSVEPYGGDDDRIGWKDVHILAAHGQGVIGFVEGPLPSFRIEDPYADYGRKANDEMHDAIMGLMEGKP